MKRVDYSASYVKMYTSPKCGTLILLYTVIFHSIYMTSSSVPKRDSGAETMREIPHYKVKTSTIGLQMSLKKTLLLFTDYNREVIFNNAEVQNGLYSNYIGYKTGVFI